MNKFILLTVVLCYSCATSQVLHPLEHAVNHYKEFKKLDSSPRQEYSDLDKIIYPPSQYRSGTLIYTMVTPEYLTPSQINTLKTSLQFPTNSSKQTRAELDYLLEWQERRTSAQESKALDFLAPIGYWPHVSLLPNHERYDLNLRHLFYLGRTVIGDECGAENYPHTTKLLMGVTKDMRIMEFTVKYHLLRARPYHLEPKLSPLATISSPSFASGHTLWAYIHAFIWSELVPEKRQEFLDIAYDIGESREIMGIHYPSDEEAARVVAHKMLSSMWNNQNFIEDFEKAKQEW